MKYCEKCGALLDEKTHLCPVCDREKLEKISKLPNFCIVCGGKISLDNGCCTACGKSYAEESGAVNETEKLSNTDVSDEAKPEVGATAEIKAEPEVTSSIGDGAPNNVPRVAPQVNVRAETPAVPKKKKNVALSVVITVFLSILLLVFVVAASLHNVIGTAISEDSLDKILDNVEYSTLVDEIYSITGEDEYDSLFESLQDRLMEKYEINLTRKDFDSFVERSDVKEFVEKNVSEIVSMVKDGSGTYRLTHEDVYELLMNDIDVLHEEISEDIDEEIIFNTSMWIVEKETISYKDMAKDEPVLMSAITLGLSDVTFIVLAVLCAVIVILMCLNSWKQALVGTGVVLLLDGAIFGVLSFMLTFMPALFIDAIGGETVVLLLRNMLALSGGVFGVVALVGAVLIIARIIVSTIMSVRRRKTN